MNKTLQLLICINFLFFSQFVSAQTSCQTSSGAITDTNVNCYAQPITYKTKIYRIGLCTSQPTPPTSNTAMGLSSCTAVFSNDSGHEVTIRKGTPTALSGTITQPATGTYSYAYAIVDPVFKTTSQFSFSPTRTNIPSSGSATSGAVCWSKSGIFFSYRSSSAKDLIDCGTSIAAVPAETLSKVNALGVENNVAQSTKVFSTPSGNMTGYLVDTSIKTAVLSPDGMGTVSYIVGVVPSTITITSSTTLLDISFDITNGTTVEINGTGTRIEAFGVGPFSPVFSVN